MSSVVHLIFVRVVGSAATETFIWSNSGDIVSGVWIQSHYLQKNQRKRLMDTIDKRLTDPIARLTDTLDDRTTNRHAR